LKGSVVIVACVVSLAAFACSGGDSDDPSRYEGEVSSAVSAFFNQERAGGVLPEGVGPVIATGIRKEQIHSLSTEGHDGVTARFCIEYGYQRPPTPAKTRVYTAELLDAAWSVEAVNPDGTCEGVS
jgi:hypothetical protein